MAAHLFNESGQMQEVDIPDIFDVLVGGEDESAVKLLLGFSAEDEAAVALMTEGGGGGLSIAPGIHEIKFYHIFSLKKLVISKIEFGSKSYKFQYFRCCQHVFRWKSINTIWHWKLK